MKTYKLFIAALGLIISCSSPSEDQSEGEKADTPALEQKATQAQENLEEKQERFNKYVSLECLEKSYEQHDNQEFIHYKFRITNKTDKEVTLMRGNVTFTNKQGHKIKTFPMSYTGPIKSGDEALWEAETTFDQFMDEEEALKTADVKELDCYWEPVQITFADGSTIE